MGNAAKTAKAAAAAGGITKAVPAPTTPPREYKPIERKASYPPPKRPVISDEMIAKTQEKDESLAQMLNKLSTTVDSYVPEGVFPSKEESLAMLKRMDPTWHKRYLHQPVTEKGEKQSFDVAIEQDLGLSNTVSERNRDLPDGYQDASRARNEIARLMGEARPLPQERRKVEIGQSHPKNVELPGTVNGAKLQYIFSTYDKSISDGVKAEDVNQRLADQFGLNVDLVSQMTRFCVNPSFTYDKQVLGDMRMGYDKRRGRPDFSDIKG